MHARCRNLENRTKAKINVMISSSRLLLGSLGVATIVGASGRLGVIMADHKGDKEPYLSDMVPSRSQQLSKIRECSKTKPFDMLIIGGGATGSGCALDAATRYVIPCRLQTVQFIAHSMMPHAMKTRQITNLGSQLLLNLSSNTQGRKDCAD